MLFKFETFPGFAAEDFQAFEERKFRSNRFNLERMKVRAKLDSLGRELAGRFEGKLGGLGFRTTLDHPHIFNRNSVSDMWLYLDREETERNQLVRVVDKDLSLQVKVRDSMPQHQAAVVSVGIALDGVSLFYRLHSDALLDRRNLSARLVDPAEQGHLAVLLQRLAPGVEICFGGEAPLALSKDCGAEFRKRLDSFLGWLTVGWRMASDDEVVGGPELVTRVAESLPGLLAIWQFGAWTRDNDRLRLSKALKEEKKQKAKRLSGFEQGDEVSIVSGLLAGKSGSVVSVDLKGRVKVQVGRMSIEMEAKLLRKS